MASLPPFNSSKERLFLPLISPHPLSAQVNSNPRHLPTNKEEKKILKKFGVSQATISVVYLASLSLDRFEVMERVSKRSVEKIDNDNPLFSRESVQ